MSQRNIFFVQKEKFASLSGPVNSLHKMRAFLNETKANWIPCVRGLIVVIRSIGPERLLSLRFNKVSVMGQYATMPLRFERE